MRVLPYKKHENVKLDSYNSKQQHRDMYKKQENTTNTHNEKITWYQKSNILQHTEKHAIGQR